ncbi:UNVERIFIED_CONTAM: hypothetical protein GTU68_022667 [Idotea baltica]|nr:hypothetical protein [Idotea baltica]
MNDSTKTKKAQPAQSPKKVHLVLQGKGGVGKTLTAVNIAQYIRDERKLPDCYDTDPINNSFLNFEGLKVSVINIIEENQVNPRLFDDLMEKILASNNDVVIDSGATTFLNILNYIHEFYILDMLKEAGFTVYIHVVLSGGQDLRDTLNGLSELINKFELDKEANIIVWKNPYHGQFLINGEKLEETEKYLDIKDRINGVVTINDVPANQKATFGRDIEDLLERRLTYSEALESTDFTIMSKQRLKILKNDLFKKMDAVNL